MRRPPDDKVPGQGAPRDSATHQGDPHSDDQVAREDSEFPIDPRHHVEVALESASAGWPVFPCYPTETRSHKAKAPATEHGFKDATESPHRIEAWWDGHPEYLVATPTEGLVVVDLDEGGNLAPLATWTWWCRQAEPHGWDPTVAPIVATPRGGVHIYFRQPDGVEVRSSNSKLAAGVDIKATGGYVIAPGSVLPDGREYELLSPYPRALIDAPEWLIDACNRTDPPRSVTPCPTSTASGTRYGLQALDGELGRLARTPEGQRNHALNRAAFKIGQLVAGGQLESHYANDQLEAVALRIGLTATETEASIKSGMTNGALNPRRPAA